MLALFSSLIQREVKHQRNLFVAALSYKSLFCYFVRFEYGGFSIEERENNDEGKTNALCADKLGNTSTIRR